MSETKQVTIICVGGSASTAEVEFNGQKHSLALGEKCRKYNPKGLSIGKKYDISYDEDTMEMFFAKLNAEESNKEVSKKPLSSLPFDIRDEKILAQSTLKEAVQLYINANPGDAVNFEVLIDLHKSIYAYMSEGGYKK